MLIPSASARENWEAETFRFLHQQKWSPQNQNILLAVSGGADSTALFHFWVYAAAQFFKTKIAVAHINHGLRATSYDDANFVRALCQKANVPFCTTELDPKTRPPRKSIEMWARENRYAFFEKAAQATNSHFILTAHHRDDLVETIFQRLARGTGPRGLAGIPFQRGEKIIRPFLNRSHEEILTYLNLLPEDYCQDETNLDIRINRNWFRHRYLPNKRISEHNLDERIFSIAMTMQKIKSGLDKLEEDSELMIRDNLNRPTLSREPIAQRLKSEDFDSLTFWLRKLLSESLRQASSPHELLGSTFAPALSLSHLMELKRQFEQVGDNLKVPISKRISLKMNKQGLYCIIEPLKLAQYPNLFAPKANVAPKKAYSFASQLGIILDTGHKSTCVLKWQWESNAYQLFAKKISRPKDLVFPSSEESKAHFDASLFSSTFAIRTRCNGDCFSPLGISSRSRKLKSFFNEKKVSVGMRNNLPLILSHGTIAWVPGYGVSEFFKVSDSTTSILELVLICEIL